MAHQIPDKYIVVKSISFKTYNWNIDKYQVY